MQVLLIEDSVRLRQTVAEGLRKSGYAVDVAGDGPTGLWQAQSGAYDVIVLDLMLPGLDGWALLQRLRDGGSEAHVLILTARDAVEDRVRGLRLGGDDYLVKPFAFDELLARVQALVRRQYRRKNPVIVVGELSIDTAARLVTRGGSDIRLAPREYAILEYMAMREGTVVSRTELESHVYEAGADPMSNVIDAAICALRRKLDQPGGGESLIQTRRGMGYVLTAARPRP